jgi:hypothetical protein
MFKRDDALDTSKLAYYVTIDMEVHPGTSIKPDEMRTLKCQQKWNAIRKAYAGFVGKPYTIPPVYQTVKNKPNEGQNKRGGRNKTRRKRMS